MPSIGVLPFSAASAAAAAAAAAALLLLALRPAAAAENLFSADERPQYVLVSSRRSNVKVSDGPVEYEITFKNLWTRGNHQPDYPPGPHWSPPLFLSHNCMYSMWGADAEASPGVQSVAETGDLRTLRREIDLDNDGNNLHSVEGVVQFVNTRTSQTMDGTLCVDEGHPFVTGITMIAPSPDWFSGMYNFMPIRRGRWLQSATIEVFPWDAGTDSGPTYTSGNQKTDPQDQISQFDISAGEVFVSQRGNSDPEIRPVAEITFRRVANTSGSCNNLAARTASSAMPSNLQKRVAVEVGRGNRRRTRQKSCRRWVASNAEARCSRDVAGDGQFAGQMVKDVCRSTCFCV